MRGKAAKALRRAAREAVETGLVRPVTVEKPSPLLELVPGEKQWAEGLAKEMGVSLAPHSALMWALPLLGKLHERLEECERRLHIASGGGRIIVP